MGITMAINSKHSKHRISKEELAAYEEQIGKAEELLPKITSDQIKKSRKKAENHRVTKEEKEARMLLIQRMLFRKIPKKEIAKQLNLTPRHLSRIIKDLEEYTVSEVKRMDFPQFVGNTLTFYDEVRGMSLIMASDKDTTKKERLQAMQVALRAESEKHNFFSLCGVYKSPHAIDEARRLIAPDSDLVGDDVSNIVSGLAKHLLTVNPNEVKGFMDKDVQDAEIVEDSTTDE